MLFNSDSLPYFSVFVNVVYCNNLVILMILCIAQFFAV